MKFELRKSGPRISATDLDRVEGELGARLPQEYREFLLGQNGGRPQDNVFDIDGKYQAGIEDFFGLYGDCNIRDLLFRQQLLEGRLPENVIEIADASCGNGVCLSLRDDSFGSVYFFDHEMEVEFDSWAALSQLARSLTEFFEKVRPFDSDSIELKPDQVLSVWIDPDFLKELEENEPEIFIKPPKKNR